MNSFTHKMRMIAIISAAFIFGFLANTLPTAAQVSLLNPDTIPKFLDALPTPAFMQHTTTDPVYNNAFSADTDYYHIGMYPIEQQYHANWPMTPMWGYGPDQANAHSPSNTILAFRHRPMNVHWTNNLVDGNGVPLVHPFLIDRTIPWADVDGQGPLMTPYQGPVPTVVHMHGAEVQGTSDGHYSAWYTPDVAPNVPGVTGPTYDCSQAGNKQVYTYNNEQPPTLIWYHDHAFGIDRLNVMMGLFGGCAIVDANDPLEFGPNHQVPVGDAYDVPLIVQDRKIASDFSISYDDPAAPTNPDVHPYWFPEFFGNIIVVNGKVWPFKDVEARKYRFRFLNGSNARFYHFYLSDGVMLDATGTPTQDPAQFDHYNQINMGFLQIGSDGGFLQNAVAVTDFFAAPAERPDVIIDFNGITPGTDVYLVNDAAGPYPTGAPVDANVGMIMKFHVIAKNSDDSYMTLTDGSQLKPALPALNPTVTRNIVLFEKEGPGGPLAMFLDGIDMSDPRSIYKPVVGTTETWNIINTTMDAHPMHIHLTQFRMTGRQAFLNYLTDAQGNMTIDPNGYLYAFEAANPILPIPYDAPFNAVDVNNYFTGSFMPPAANEEFAMKDTWICPPSTLTTFVIRWTQEDGSAYGFDATRPPGYVWHCHILEHEENAMMREIHPVTAPPSFPSSNMSLWLSGIDTRAYGPVHYTNMMPKYNQWMDISGNGNTAVQPAADMQPMHDGYGLNCWEAVAFMPMANMTMVSAFKIPYAPLITTATTSTVTPDATDKSLFVTFEPHTLTGRQTIYESGRDGSGFNIYTDNGYLYFGMWNKLEAKFLKYTTQLQLGHDQVYLAQLEYNAATQRFRALVNGNEAVSMPMTFRGLTMIDQDPSGVGAAVGGTRYHDKAVGFSYSDNFNGNMGDILLYNATFNTSDAQQVYDYLGWKYGKTWTYPTSQPAGLPWQAYEEYSMPASLAAVNTVTVSNVTSVSALCNSNITSLGACSVTTRGICWSTNPFPTIDDNTNEQIGAFSTGTYQLSVTNLLYGTTYYVRAYAKNCDGYVYGAPLQFTTVNYPQIVLSLVDKATCAGTNISIGNPPNEVTGGSGVFTYSWSPTVYLGASSTSDNPQATNPRATQRYTLTVTDVNSGLRTSAVMTMTVNPIVNPVMPSLVRIGSGIFSVNLNSYVTSPVYPADGYIYGWDTPNPASAPIGVGMTSYHLTLTSPNGCTAPAKTITFYKPTFRFGEPDDNEIIAGLNSGIYAYVYPVPTTGLISVEGALGQKSDVTISVVNTIGQEVFHTQRYDTDVLNEQLDLSSIAAGQYLMIIRAGDVVTTKQVIKY